MAKWKVLICKTCNTMQHSQPYYRQGQCNKYKCKAQIEERENHTFNDDLEFIAFHRTGTGFRSWWKSKRTGTKYCVSMSKVDDFVKQSVNGVCSGSFTFSKHGTHYSLMMTRAQTDTIFV